MSYEIDVCDTITVALEAEETKLWCNHCDCYHYITRTIIHMNDKLGYSFDRIADYLESVGVNPTLKNDSDIIWRGEGEYGDDKYKVRYIKNKEGRFIRLK